MPRSRPPYAPEYRRQMIELVRAGRTPEDLAREFEPSSQAIGNWFVQADRDEGRRGDGPSTAQQEELRGLRREIRRLREERDILAKVCSGDRTGEVYRFMRAHQAEFRIATMARVLGVSPSGYYAWRKRERSAHEAADEALSERVQAIHQRSRGTYGAPRIHAELAAEGTCVSRKRVARVMREAGLAAVSRRKGPRTTRRDPKARPAPDLVERRFEADAPSPAPILGGTSKGSSRPVRSR